MGTAARDTGVSRAAVPKVPGSLRREEIDSRYALSCFYRVIRAIVVLTGRGAMMPGCKAVSGSFAVPIRPIVVPTGRGATQASIPNPD